MNKALISTLQDCIRSEAGVAAASLLTRSDMAEEYLHVFEREWNDETGT